MSNVAAVGGEGDAAGAGRFYERVSLGCWPGPGGQSLPEEVMMGPGLKGQRRGWGGHRGQEQGLLEALGRGNSTESGGRRTRHFKNSRCRWSQESKGEQGNGCSQEAPGGTQAMSLQVLVLAKSNGKLLK